MSNSETNCNIQWIVIYRVDSVIHRLNNWGLEPRLYGTQIIITARSTLSRDSNDVVLARKVFCESIQHGGELTVLLTLL